MSELTQEALIGGVALALSDLSLKYGYEPTNVQIQDYLKVAGFEASLERIKQAKEIVKQLERHVDEDMEALDN